MALAISTAQASQIFGEHLSHFTQDYNGTEDLRYDHINWSQIAVSFRTGNIQKQLEIAFQMPRLFSPRIRKADQQIAILRRFKMAEARLARQGCTEPKPGEEGGHSNCQAGRVTVQEKSDIGTKHVTLPKTDSFVFTLDHHVEILGADSFKTFLSHAPKDKPVFIDIFSSQCPHCQRAKEFMNADAERIKGKVTLAALQIALRSNPEMEKYYENNDVMHSLRVKSVPTRVELTYDHAEKMWKLMRYYVISEQNGERMWKQGQ